MKVEKAISVDQMACLEAVQRLNNELHDKFGWDNPDLPIISMRIARYHYEVSITLYNSLEIVLFNSSENDRIYYEKPDKYENFYPYLKRKFRETKQYINQIKL
jgi:hypothetical protein